MNKIKKFCKTHYKWLAPVAVALTVALVVTLCYGPLMGRVTSFKDYRVYGEGQRLESMSDTVVPDTLPRLEIFIREGLQGTTTFNRGVIAVVRVGSVHQNVLGEFVDGKAVKYHETGVYPESYDPGEIKYTSHVRTEVEILELIFQTEHYQYKAGDRIKLKEYYFIADQRLPSLMNRWAPGKEREVFYQNGWVPTENDEIYIIYGDMTTIHWDNDTPETLFYPYEHGIYCLSDTSLPVGCVDTDEARAEGLAYLWQTYPEIMEKYADK